MKKINKKPVDTIAIKFDRNIVPDEDQNKAEQQILQHQAVVDYDTREFPVEVIVQKYRDGLENDENELFVPGYQRDFVWDNSRQSKFIESVLLSLPIPYIFTADRNGRLEIVDGSQRIRSLHAFVTNELVLVNLKRLTLLNGFRYGNLPISRQRRFNRHTLRMIELTDKADYDITRDIFERINTGSDNLRAMEIRKGLFAGPFYEFIASCADDRKFNKLCPINIGVAKREEAEEMILRFFAYSERYLEFKHSVKDFLDNYIKNKRETFDKDAMQGEFNRMLNFVEHYFPYGFKRTKTSTTTPRVRFEAISVGVNLAIKEDPGLEPPAVDWLDTDAFKSHTRSDASNSRPKVKGRIEFVRDKLLGKK